MGSGKPRRSPCPVKIELGSPGISSKASTRTMKWKMPGGKKFVVDSMPTGQERNKRRPVKKCWIELANQ